MLRVHIVNSVKLTLSMLIFFSMLGLFAIFIFDLNKCISGSFYYLLGLMLFPMSHFFNTYKTLLEVRTFEGLKNSEIKRLNSTVSLRSNSIIKVMIIYLVCICAIAILGATNVLSAAQTLVFSIAIIISSLIDTVIAWKAIQEIRDFEQTVILRKNRQKALDEIVKRSNERK